MKKIITLLLLIYSVSCVADEQAAMITMEISPNIDMEKSQAVLEFKLTYEGRESVTVDAANLLGSRVARSISFQANRFINVDSKPIINCPKPEEKIFIDDPGVGNQIIKPGESYKQKIDLYQIYYEFEKILGKCDFVFYWSYKLDIKNSFEAPRIGGAVVIPAGLDVEKIEPISVNLTAKES